MGLSLSLQAQQWTCLGPYGRPIDMGGAGNFTGNGMITAIDFSHNDSNKIFLGTAGGGIWLFDRKKDSSFSLHFDTVCPYIGIASIAIDPMNDRHIIVSNGDKIGPFDWNDNMAGATGIYFTQDGGHTWYRSRFQNHDGGSFSFDYAPYNYARIPKIIFNPLNPHTVLCVEHALWNDGKDKSRCGHIYISHDGGVTFSEMYNFFFEDTYFNDIVYDPADTNTLYAASHKLYLSKDGGRSWHDRTAFFSGYTPENNMAARICLSTSPLYSKNPGIAILTLSAIDEDRNHLYFIPSTDNAHDTAIQPVNISGLNNADFSPKFKYGVCLGPSVSIFYIFGTLFQASYDSGHHFTLYSYSEQMHPDVHCLGVSPFSSLSDDVFVGTDGGLFISHDLGKTFKHTFKGICATQLYSVAISDDGTTVMAGSQDNGTLKYDIKKQWSRLNGGGDGNNVLFAPGHRDTCLYGDFQGEAVFVSKDGGNNIQGISIPGNHSIPTPLAYISPHGLKFLVGTEDVWRAGGSRQYRLSHFEKLDSALNAPCRITGLAISKIDTNTIYVTREGQWMDGRGHVSGKQRDVSWNDTAGYSLHQVYTTNNGGKTWSDITPTIKGGIGEINSVAVSPRHKKLIWVTHNRWYSNSGNNFNVFISRNGGKIWEPYYEGLPKAPTFKIIAIPGDTVFVCMSTGVYMRTAGMKQWQNISGNLPHTLCKDLCYCARAHALYVATWGSGVWELHI